MKDGRNKSRETGGRDGRGGRVVGGLGGQTWRRGSETRRGSRVGNPFGRNL